MGEIASSVVEKTLESPHSVTVVVAVFIIAIGLNVFVKFLEIGLDTFRRKNETTDQTKIDVMRLDYQLREIQEKLNEVLRLKSSVSRAFHAIELLADDRWPEIRKAITENDPL